MVDGARASSYRDRCGRNQGIMAIGPLVRAKANGTYSLNIGKLVVTEEDDIGEFWNHFSVSKSR